MHVPSDTPLPDISATGHDQETARISKIAFYAFLLNLGLAAMKGALAVFSDSLAVTAGAIDSGTDAVASLLLFGGLKLSTRKSPSFPLGLFKIENFISIVVALLIFFAGYEIAREVVTPIAGKPSISMAVVLLLLAGVLATHLFGRYAATSAPPGGRTLLPGGPVLGGAGVCWLGIHHLRYSHGSDRSRTGPRLYRPCRLGASHRRHARAPGCIHRP